MERDMSTGVEIRFRGVISYDENDDDDDARRWLIASSERGRSASTIINV